MGCCMSADQVDMDRRRDIPLMVPNRNRKCTDLPCLSLFVIYWCVMITISIFSFVYGDPYRLIYGSDTFGNVCGKQNQYIYANNSGLDMTDRKFLFPMDIFKPSETVWICVNECPQAQMYSREKLQEYYEDRGVGYCSYEVPKSEYNMQVKHQSSAAGPCPVLPVYESEAILNWCIPKKAIQLFPQLVGWVFSAVSSVDTLKLALADLAIVWLQMIALAILAFVVALVMVFLLRFAAGFVVYIIFILTILTALAVTGLLWYGFAMTYISINTPSPSDTPEQLLENQEVQALKALVENVSNEDTLCFYAISATIVTIILIVVIIFMWKSAKLLVDLFANASRALQSMPCLLMQPVYTFFALFIVFCYWLLIVLMLATADRIVSNHHNISMPYNEAYIGMMRVQYEKPKWVTYCWWIHTIGCLWTSEFIIAGQQMVVAGSVAIWYFTRDKKAFTYPICVSYKQLFQNHLGSVALGAFIITLVKLPRLILMYFYAKLKDSQIPWVQSLAKCCICCLMCIEKCLRYLHHNAYTVIAIEGKSFCPAAAQAFRTLAGNPVYVGSINSIGDFVLFLAKLAVVGVVGVFAAFVFANTPNVHYWSVPFAIICVFAYLVAHCFFSVYEMAIDTLFLCFAEDKDIADSTGSVMFADEGIKDYMSNTLRRAGRDPNVIRTEQTPQQRNYREAML